MMNTLFYGPIFYSMKVDLDERPYRTIVKLSRLIGNCNLNLNRIYISDIFHCDGVLLLRTTWTTTSLWFGTRVRGKPGVSNL